MSITATNAVMNISSPASQTARLPVPDKKEIEEFNQIMFGSNQGPEQTMINTVELNHNALKEYLAPIEGVIEKGGTEESLLRSQEHLMRTSVSIDLGAKVAGQLSQAINKLVSMQ